MVYNRGYNNMKNIPTILSAIVLTVLAGCSKFDGDPTTKEFTINNTYTELDVSNAFNVTVSDEVSQVTITAGDRIMSKVIVEEKNGTLTIRLKNLTVANGTLTAIIPYNPNLNEVDLSGASEFHSPHPIVAQEVNIELSGASNFYGDIEAATVDMGLSGASTIEGSIVATTKLDLELSGASDATLTGAVGTLDLELSGSSDIKQQIVGNRYALSCERCEGDISGAGTAYIHCDGAIAVTLSGSSNLHYTGNASTSGCSTSGSSNVIHDVL